MKAEERNVILLNWTNLNKYLVGINELGDLDSKQRDLKSLLDYERKNTKRKMFLERIHQKLVRVRAANERRDILGESEEGACNE